MGSESDEPAADGVKASTRSSPRKRCRGKVPRKINKAAREKLKRDSMNELFLDLEKTLGLEHPNNGKASILRETSRLLVELLKSVESLKKANETLLSESNYVTVEKNELLEETCALDAEIKRLQREIDERANCSIIDASQPQTNSATLLPEDHASFPLVAHAPDSAPVLGPVFVMPLHHESQGFPNPFPEVSVPKVPSSVSRPRPRYPSASDSWPSNILAK
ncbi:hypothetical protein ACS0TY_028995 [Phlomoides rotata]